MISLTTPLLAWLSLENERGGTTAASDKCDHTTGVIFGKDDMFIMESASRPVIPDLVPLPSAGVLAWPRRRGRPW